jgi:antitoxin HicB
MAIEEAMAARISEGLAFAFPAKETSGRGVWVEVPLLTLLKAALHNVCLEQGTTRAELARRLDWHREQVDRLFRLDHKSRLDQLEAAFKAIGAPLSFNLPIPAAAA